MTHTTILDWSSPLAPEHPARRAMAAIRRIAMAHCDVDEIDGVDVWTSTEARDVVRSLHAALCEYDRTGSEWALNRALRTADRLAA